MRSHRKLLQVPLQKVAPPPPAPLLTPHLSLARDQALKARLANKQGPLLTPLNRYEAPLPRVSLWFLSFVPVPVSHMQSITIAKQTSGVGLHPQLLTNGYTCTSCVTVSVGTLHYLSQTLQGAGFIMQHYEPVALKLQH